MTKPRSPAFWRCMAKVKEIAGEKLTDKEMENLAEKLLARAREIKRERTGTTADAAVNEALKEAAEEVAGSAALAKRSAYLNHSALVREVGGLQRNWSDKPVDGVSAMLVGTNVARRGAQKSIWADQAALANHYMTGFSSRIERAGKIKIWASGDIDLDAYRAIDQLYKDNPDFSKISRDAREFAQIVFEFQELMRVDKNHAGAWIGKDPDYITHQNHDQFRVANAHNIINKGARTILGNFARASDDKNFNAWLEFVMPKLNAERTFGGAGVAESSKIDWLRRVWLALASGDHMRADGAANGWKSKGALANFLSRERILIFKDADARYEYDQMFGRGGSLYERVLSGLHMSGSQVALMRRLGPNPTETFSRIKQAARSMVEDSVDARSITKRHRDERMLDAYYGWVTGEASSPGTDPFSTALRTSRVVQNVSKLGSMTLSSITDLGTSFAELRYQGVGVADAWMTQLNGVFQGRGARGKERADRLQLASELGVAVDELRAATWSRFSSSDAMPGWATKAQGFFFKINASQWWTDTLRMANAQRMSHNLALNASNGMRKLGASEQRMLKLFDISETEWDLMRTRSVDVVEGKEFFTPKGADRITDEEIFNLLQTEGVTPTARRIKERRDDIQSKFRAFFTARSDYAVIMPGPKTHSITTGQIAGVTPGSPASEVVKSLMQFKSFPMAVIEKIWGRELFGYGESGRIRDAGMNGVTKLVSFITYSTFLGFAAMYLKAFFSGRDIKKPENATDAARLMLMSFTQGGGAGIYADFLFGQAKDRYGHSAFEALMGPTFGDVSDIYSVMRNGVDSEDFDQNKILAKSFYMTKTHMPFVNLFYTRLAFDYLILNRMQEEVSPGSLRRTEKKFDKIGQRYRLPPSKHYKAEKLTLEDIGRLVFPFNSE